MITQFKNCRICGEEFYSKTNEHLVCDNCKPIEKKQKKIKNRQLMQKRHLKNSQKDYKQTGIIKKKLLNEQRENFGKFFCEECGGTFGFYHAHHIIFRSQLRKNPRKHNPINILILCENCHNQFHGPQGHELQKKWIIKRNLIDLYPDIKNNLTTI